MTEESKPKKSSSSKPKKKEMTFPNVNGADLFEIFKVQFYSFVGDRKLTNKETAEAEEALGLMTEIVLKQLNGETTEGYVRVTKNLDSKLRMAISNSISEVLCFILSRIDKAHF
tara:strand:- start:20 stop:361 length:342 start_codon:yes stop_codon:yes gene_type:complete